MVKEIKTEYDVFDLSATYHGDEEYILQAGNMNRTAFKVFNRIANNSEVFQIWTRTPVQNKKDVLVAFQKLLFNGLSGGLEPNMFAEALSLEFEALSTEMRYNYYNQYYRKLGNVFHKLVVADAVLDQRIMKLIQKLYREGIDCGLHLDRNKVV